MVYEIFDLYGFADLWQKVVRLSPPDFKLDHLGRAFLLYFTTAEILVMMQFCYMQLY